MNVLFPIWRAKYHHSQIIRSWKISFIIKKTSHDFQLILQSFDWVKGWVFESHTYSTTHTLWSWFHLVLHENPCQVSRLVFTWLDFGVQTSKFMSDYPCFRASLSDVWIAKTAAVSRAKLSFWAKKYWPHGTFSHFKLPSRVFPAGCFRVPFIFSKYGELTKRAVLSLVSVATCWL